MKAKLVGAVLLAVLSVAIGQAFAKQEKPKSLGVPALDVAWSEVPGTPLKIAKVWGDMTKGPHEFLLKLPAGFPGLLHTHRFNYWGVVVAGTVMNTEEGAEVKALPPGSYYAQSGTKKHTTACREGADCVIAVYFDGPFDLTAAK